MKINFNGKVLKVFGGDRMLDQLCFLHGMKKRPFIDDVLDDAGKTPVSEMDCSIAVAGINKSITLLGLEKWVKDTFGNGTVLISKMPYNDAIKLADSITIDNDMAIKMMKKIIEHPQAWADEYNEFINFFVIASEMNGVDIPKGCTYQISLVAGKPQFLIYHNGRALAAVDEDGKIDVFTYRSEAETKAEPKKTEKKVETIDAEVVEIHQEPKKAKETKPAKPATEITDAEFTEVKAKPEAKGTKGEVALIGEHYRGRLYFNKETKQWEPEKPEDKATKAAAKPKKTEEKKEIEQKAEEATAAAKPKKTEEKKEIEQKAEEATAAETTTIVERHNLKLLYAHVAEGSLKHIPAEVKAHVMMRLEGAIRMVCQDKKAKAKYFGKDKYGVMPSFYNGQDDFMLTNGNRYWKFIMINGKPKFDFFDTLEEASAWKESLEAAAKKTA